MLNVVLSNQFKRDLKTISKRGYDMNKLDKVVNTLMQGNPLEPKHRDHSFSGGYSGFRECHITPDWLLIYRVNNDELFLLLFRTGTHSDLF